MIHFVYAHQHDTQEIHSPHSITRNLYEFLSTKDDVKYYQWDHVGVADVEEHDILIGHPHYDTNTVVHRTIKERKCKLKCTIHPLHTGMPEHNMPFNCLTELSDIVFSICGPYWYDTIDKTPFASWKPKITRLDMAVDGNHFPFLRKKFNNIGSRRLLYIGSTMPMKNVGYLYEIMKRLKNVELYWYGGDSSHPLSKLPNVTVFGWTHLNAAVARSIIDKCDIFVNVSSSDANPTTLLESMAWGMIPACTKESGYYNDELFTELYIHDIEKTIHAINNLLNASEEVLLDRAFRGRKEIESKYTWNRFCNQIWNRVVAHIGDSNERR